MPARSLKKFYNFHPNFKISENKIVNFKISNLKPNEGQKKRQT